MVTTSTLRAQKIDVDGLALHVTTGGDGPPVVLLHGWPHTSRVWHPVTARLAATCSVLAPDLRGIGESAPVSHGFDAGTLADDVVGLLDAAGIDRATIVAIDASVATAVLLALRAPQRVERLVVMEGLAGRLPGAEAFLVAGPPWWFGFHTAGGLAERVLAGHEAEYVAWFLRSGTRDGRGVDSDVEAEITTAYAREGALARSLGLYRALPESAEQLAAAAPGRLAVPVLAVAGGVVGDALHGQLQPIADDLSAASVADCGHLVPLEQPERLAALIAAGR